MKNTDIQTILPIIPGAIKDIVAKVLDNQRISVDDALVLYTQAELGLLGCLAQYVNSLKNGNIVFYNKNIHVEPTNICIHDCVFCSYARKKGESGAWESSINDMLQKLSAVPDNEITEVHIVGGVHPERDIDFYCSLLSQVAACKPGVHIKAFTAIEIEFMAIKSNLSITQALQKLKDAGLNSLPGGGAEIFDESIREKICKSKTNADSWLRIHETAHSLGLSSNATILYGHLENYEQRVDHLHKLRNLQDKTNGFKAFIPLKYKMEHNSLGINKEVTWIEDLRNFAISRLFLDNFQHLKAYWPMLGKDLAQISLEFGVNDLDGTINDSTKIYAMAGAQEKNPSMSEYEIKELIFAAQRIPKERDSNYNYR